MNVNDLFTKYQHDGIDKNSPNSHGWILWDALKFVSSMIGIIIDPYGIFGKEFAYEYFKKYISRTQSFALIIIPSNE